MHLLLTEEKSQRAKIVELIDVPVAVVTVAVVGDNVGAAAEIASNQNLIRK